MSECGSVLSLGDDFGDNSCTFHCQLPEGHEGMHQEEFAHTEFPSLESDLAPVKRIVQWEGDCRPICYRCKKRTTERTKTCYNDSCTDLFFMAGERQKIREFCRECAQAIGICEDEWRWFCSKECHKCYIKLLEESK